MDFVSLCRTGTLDKVSPNRKYLLSDLLDGIHEVSLHLVTFSYTPPFPFLPPPFLFLAIKIIILLQNMERVMNYNQITKC